MPPHILLLAVVGVGLITGYRMAHRAMQKRARDNPPDVASNEPRDLGSLDRDEATGEYRPRHH